MAHAIDEHVGRRIRSARWLRGMNQQELGARTGVKFQQIQKYETGANRVSASRLWDIAEVLGLSITYFFEGVGLDDEDLTNVLQDKEAVELVRAYYNIPKELRARLFDLAQALAPKTV